MSIRTSSGRSVVDQATLIGATRARGEQLATERRDRELADRISQLEQREAKGAEAFATYEEEVATLDAAIRATPVTDRGRLPELQRQYTGACRDRDQTATALADDRRMLQTLRWSQANPDPVSDAAIRRA